MNKESALLDLANRRKNTRWTGYRNIGDYHNGIYECDFVSPYSKSAGNVNSDMLIFLQDWSSHERLSGDIDPNARIIGHSPELPSNRNLKDILAHTFSKRLSDVYVTNLFPFIKVGGMGTTIPAYDLERAAREFAIPQILIVRPKLVVCLGLHTFNAVRVACGFAGVEKLGPAIATPFSFEGARVWCQAHTARCYSNRGGKQAVFDDWNHMKSDVWPSGAQVSG